MAGMMKAPIHARVVSPVRLAASLVSRLKLPATVWFINRSNAASWYEGNARQGSGNVAQYAIEKAIEQVV